MRALPRVTPSSGHEEDEQEDDDDFTTKNNTQKITQRHPNP
jgi:hypothetical protein